MNNQEHVMDVYMEDGEDPLLYEDNSAFAFVPEEILQIIFSYLPQKALATVSRVCKYWKHVAYEIWSRRVIYIMDSTLLYLPTPQEFGRMLSRRNPTRVSFDSFTLNHLICGILEDIFKKCPHISSISLSNTNLEDVNVFDCVPPQQLVSLDVSNSGIESDELAKIATQMHPLRTVNMIRCNVRDNVMIGILESCSESLSNLNCSMTPISNSTIAAISQIKVRKLALSGCSKIDTTGLNSLASFGNPMLQTLHSIALCGLDGIVTDQFISDLVSNAVNLRSIDLSFNTSSITNKSLETILRGGIVHANLGMCLKIDSSGWSDFLSSFVDIIHFNTLSLSSFGLSRRGPWSLLTLSLAGCNKVSDHGFELLKLCENLHTLNVSGTRVGNVAVNVLESLPRIRKVILPRLSRISRTCIAAFKSRRGNSVALHLI